MNALATDPGFAAFKDVDFNWAVRLQDVWSTAVGDVPEIHAEARTLLLDAADQLAKQTGDGNPLGRFISGAGGTGKTHLLNAVQDELVTRGFGFILVDMTDVRDFWETVAQGYINSLQNVYADDLKQYQVLIQRFIGTMNADPEKSRSNLQILAKHKSSKLRDDIRTVLNVLGSRHQQATLRYQDTIRALICLNSAEFEIANMGSSWLQGLDIDETLGKELQFQKQNQPPREIVRSLSWVMSLTGPTVLAFDQLDPIVHQVARQQQTDNPAEQNTARWIIDQIGNGLGALRDTTVRTLVVVSCLEATYSILRGEVLAPSMNRFHEPIALARPGKEQCHSLISKRLAIAYAKRGFQPPYPTWPFATSAFDSLEYESPRRVLQRCEDHRTDCLKKGSVSELQSFTVLPVKLPEPLPQQPFDALDRKFAELRGKADLNKLLDERNEDEDLRALYQTAFDCLIREHAALPDGIDAIIDREFGGGKSNRPLHGRLRVIFQNDNERETHFCVRAIQKANAAAFKTRLKAATTHAGIDRNLSFRKLTIVRTVPLPGGAETKKMIDEFKERGGHFHQPTEDEVRTLFALNEPELAGDQAFDVWLKARRPVHGLKLDAILAVNPLFPEVKQQVVTPPPVKPDPTPAEATPVPLPVEPTSTGAEETPATTSMLPLGKRVMGPDKLGDYDGPPLAALAKHTVVLAGAGSGKTVLLYRIVEEAALMGIPSIVVDCANDLAAFDEPSPDALKADSDKSKRFHDSREMILWTPGKESGNPLILQPLPDFSAVKNDPDELQDALTMASAALVNVVAAGTSQKSKTKAGILTGSLQFFAKNYDKGTLADYISLLSELPPDAGPGVSNQQKLAVEMADSLRTQMMTNPLLNTGGAVLDPAVLFGDDQVRKKTRISVINLIGLPTVDMQRTFLNQLAMILFSWIKKNPHPPGRALRGLLIVDEAKDFVPAQKSSECKESMLRLGAQARKYGLGLVFATQHPKDIDHKLVGNASTHFYGLNNSPTSLATLQDLIRQKGGTGDGIPKLKPGQFFFHSAGESNGPPVKLQVPMCLSNKRLLEEQEIMTKAKRSRQLVGG